MPVSFVAFVISMAGNAAVHFGDAPDPATKQKRQPNLDAAGQVIELLSMLEEKTRGNLTAEERQPLEQVLYELRMRYAETRKGSASGA